MRRSFSLLAIPLTFIDAVHSFVIANYSGGPIQVGNVTLPEPQYQDWNFVGSVDQVEIYGCSAARTSALQAALRIASDSAAAMRNLLDNSGLDPASFALIDRVFGNAFTRSPESHLYRNFVRGVYDTIAHAATHTFPKLPHMTLTMTRMVCLTCRNYRHAPSTARASVVDLYAAMFLYEKFWSASMSSDFNPCGNSSMADHSPSTQAMEVRAYVIMRAFAYLAGVTEMPEKLTAADMLLLGSSDAVGNPATYAYAASRKFTLL